MTGMDVAKMGCAMAGQTLEDSEDLLDITPALLDTLLAELLPYENSLRKLEGREQLDAAPRPTEKTGREGLEDPIEYCEELLRMAAPYYLACSYLQADDKDQRGLIFYNRYVDALETFRRNRLKAQTVKVRDVYAL